MDVEVDNALIKLHELSPDNAMRIEHFCQILGERIGNLKAAWSFLFDPGKDGICTHQNFVNACVALEVPESVIEGVYSTLDPDGVQAVSRKKFMSLRLWFESPQEKEFGYFANTKNRMIDEAIQARERVTMREKKKPDAVINDKLGSDADALRTLMKRKHGSTLAAWRQSMDRNGNGGASFMDFCRSAKEVGFLGNVKKLFYSLGGSQFNCISYDMVVPEDAIFIRQFVSRIKRKGGFHLAWNLMDPEKRGKVSFAQFDAVCKELGFRDPKSMFGSLSGGSITLDREQLKWLCDNTSKTRIGLGNGKRERKPKEEPVDDDDYIVMPESEISHWQATSNFFNTFGSKVTASSGLRHTRKRWERQTYLDKVNGVRHLVSNTNPFKFETPQHLVRLEFVNRKQEMTTSGREMLT